MHDLDFKEYQAITPWIISHDAPRVLFFLESAFHAKITGRLDDPETGKVMHADAQIGDMHIMVFSSDDDWSVTPAFIRLYVRNAEETMARAIRYGGTLVTPIEEQAFGDLLGRMEDPAGNLWWIAQPVDKVSFEKLKTRLGEPRWQEPMMRAVASLQRWFADR